jgi:ferredoxin
MSETTTYQKFAEMMLHKDSQYIPKFLQCMVTDEQAELLVSLPGTAVQMADKSGREVDAVRADLNDMFRKGLGCGQCAVGCPEEAIRMTEVREPGFIPE